MDQLSPAIRVNAIENLAGFLGMHTVWPNPCQLRLIVQFLLRSFCETTVRESKEIVVRKAIKKIIQFAVPLEFPLSFEIEEFTDFCLCVS